MSSIRLTVGQNFVSGLTKACNAIVHVYIRSGLDKQNGELCVANNLTKFTVATWPGPRSLSTHWQHQLKISSGFLLPWTIAVIRWQCCLIRLLQLLFLPPYIHGIFSSVYPTDLTVVKPKVPPFSERTCERSPRESAVVIADWVLIVVRDLATIASAYNRSKSGETTRMYARNGPSINWCKLQL